MKANVQNRIMSSRVIFCILSLICFSNTSFGQELIPLEVSHQKAVHLVFPSHVKYCDAGSESVVYSVTDNIVKLTAANAGFPETNLTVISDDNTLYSFLLLYNKDPRKLNLIVEQSSGKAINAAAPANATASLAAGTPEVVSAPVAPVVEAVEEEEQPVSMEEEDFNEVCLRMIQNEKSLQLTDMTNNVGLDIYNIYEYNGYHFFSMQAYNQSKKPFKLDIVNFQQADKNWAFGKMYRETLKKPVYVFNEKEVFNANGRYHIVYIFKKLKIEPGKKFLIEMGADDGKRILSLEVAERYINEAPEFKLQ